MKYRRSGHCVRRCLRSSGSGGKRDIFNREQPATAPAEPVGHGIAAPGFVHQAPVVGFWGGPARGSRKPFIDGGAAQSDRGPTSFMRGEGRAPWMVIHLTGTYAEAPGRERQKSHGSCLWGREHRRLRPDWLARTRSLRAVGSSGFFHIDHEKTQSRA